MKKTPTLKRLLAGIGTIIEKRAFLERWFKGLSRTMSYVLLAETTPKPGQSETKRPAKMVSRSDLSKTRPQEEITNLLKDKDIFFGGKGFYGTSLPLIPDIRTSEVSLGLAGKLLEAFGVSRKFGRTVTLYQGPNRRANRYLVFQYNRLIKSIDGSTVRGTVHTAAHVVWPHNFYKASRTLILTSQRRKELRGKARVYWGIANQLLGSSRAFRTAVIKKCMGKAGRWFHRNIDLQELFDINKKYQAIADRFSSKVEIRRKWISTQLKDGSYKWRPLGISPMAWRVYTRGINNLLETFLAGGWPDNQHGYKTGRGVHTAWSHILGTIIRCKYIFEFDFTGFFNTVRVEAVGDVLHSFYVPKYMVGYLVSMSSGDVENIKPLEMRKLATSEDPTQRGWDRAWTGYEYIHRFRKGFRSIGLAQGHALSPVLSVLTLIVLDELAEKGIKHILYCDDGLFYSNKPHDFLGVAQSVLDRHGIGAFFNRKKSYAIKEAGVWLKRLKFCGLQYDPFEDLLTAATRNGATLSLDVSAVGVFTRELLNPVLSKISETCWLDWIATNDRFFEAYESIYVMPGYGEDYKQRLYDSLSEDAYNAMVTRINDHDSFSIAEVITTSQGGVELIDYLAPIRLLRNIHKGHQRDLVDRYKLKFGDDFPWDLLLQDPYMLGLYWMDKELSSEEYAKILNAKRERLENVAIENGLMYSSSKVEPLPAPPCSLPFVGGDSVINQLVWFSSCDSPPPSLAGRNIKLGTWFATRLEELGELSLPSEVVDILKGDGKIMSTRVTWRNLFRDPIFSTFIARLFQDSFRSGVVKQDFRLTYDRSADTLVGLIYRFIGSVRWDSLEGCDRLDVFNSSSFCCHLLSDILDLWDPAVRDKKSRRVPAFKRVYKEIIKRISTRRSEVDWIRPTGMNQSRGRPQDQSLDARFPLVPYLNERHPKHRTNVKLIMRRNDVNDGLHIKTITRSSISEHERHTNHTKWDMFLGLTPRPVESFKSVRWDTFAPKDSKSRKPRIISATIAPLVESVIAKRGPLVWTSLRSANKKPLTPKWEPISNKYPKMARSS